jgi:hypothetical protein
MVSIPERYYISTDGIERGPYTLNQVASMWCLGTLTSNALYRLSNIERWTPLSQLEETLRFIHSSHPVQGSGEALDEPAVASPSIGSQGTPSSTKANSPVDPSTPILTTQGIALPKDFAVKVSQQLASLQEAAKLDPSGKKAKTMADHFLESWRPILSPDTPPILDKKVGPVPKAVNPSEALEARAAYEQLRDKMLSQPGAHKLQALAAKFALAQGFGTTSGEMTAHLENVAAGRPIPKRWLTGDECQKLGTAFRLKWALLHLAFWLFVGFLWIGLLAVLGAMFSIFILGIQLQWKKRQLLHAMGIPQAEVNRRVPGIF